MYVGIALLSVLLKKLYFITSILFKAVVLLYLLYCFALYFDSIAPKVQLNLGITENKYSLKYHCCASHLLCCTLLYRIVFQFNHIACCIEYYASFA